MPSRSELAARRLVDPMIVEPVAPTRAVQETVTPSRRELANAIRALSMDRTTGGIRPSWRTDGDGGFRHGAVE